MSSSHDKDVVRAWQHGFDETQRKIRWANKLDRKAIAFHSSPSPPPLPASLQSEIELSCQSGQLNRVLTSQPLTTRAISTIQSLLTLDVAYNRRDRYVEGYAQLYAHVNAALNDPPKTFGLIQALTPRLSELQSDPPTLPHCRIDTLILAAALARDCAELTNHFNHVHFDVVDLSDLYCAYAPCLFANHFTAEFVYRLIDVLVTDNEAHCYLYALMYGLLRTHAKQLITHDAANLYTYLIDLPSTLSKAAVNDVFLSAYKYVRSRSDEMIALEKKCMEWSALVAIPGPITFTKTTGQANQTSASTSGTQTPLQGISPQLQHMNDEAKSAASLETINSSLHSLTISDLNSVTPESLIDRLTSAESETDVSKLRAVVRSIRDDLKKSLPPPMPQSTTLSPIHSRHHSLSVASTSTTNQTTAVPPAPLRVPTGALIKFSELALYQSFPCLYHNGYLLKSRQATRFLARNKRVPGATGHGSMNLGGGLFGAALHRRYFVLQGHFLTYFKSQAYPKPSRDESMDMRKCWIETLNGEEFVQFGYGFEIQIRTAQSGKQANAATANSVSTASNSLASAPPTEPLFVLFASDDASRKLWIAVLRKATMQDS